MPNQTVKASEQDLWIVEELSVEKPYFFFIVNRTGIEANF
jgi:hypothetical protein